MSRINEVGLRNVQKATEMLKAWEVAQDEKDYQKSLDSMNAILEVLGGKPLYRTKAEFDALMADPNYTFRF